MSEATNIPNSATPAAGTTLAGGNLLQQAIGFTKQTDPVQAQALIQNLVQETLNGTVVWNKNLSVTITNAISKIDQLISDQLAAVMHDPNFLTLEGSWQGLRYLVMNSETGESLKIKILNCAKEELFKDLDRAVEFDQSQFYKQVYEAEFGSPGGEPYSVLVGNYYFDNNPDDIDMLGKISDTAAAAFCPFIAATSPTLFGFNQWSELAAPRDLEKIFDSLEYAKWRSFRETEDSRFVTLVMPRTLARLPYGAKTKPIDEFDFEEIPLDKQGQHNYLDPSDYCWMNTAFVHAGRLTEAFATYGWCTAIRGAENGGKVESLPLHVFTSDSGDMDSECPTEIGITDRREAELSKLGFLPLCHYKNTDYAVFFGAQTVQKPGQYDKPEATANAAISARLPYILAVSRFAHYLKIMGRDKIGAFMEVKDVEAWLNRWIIQYVNGNAASGAELKARFPLAEAKVVVEEVPGAPGSYNAVAWLRPWLQMEELTASLRLVASIPQLK